MRLNPDKVEFWLIICCAIIISLIVLAAIGYYSGKWFYPEELT